MPELEPEPENIKGTDSKKQRRQRIGYSVLGIIIALSISSFLKVWKEERRKAEHERLYAPGQLELGNSSADVDLTDLGDNRIQMDIVNSTAGIPDTTATVNMGNTPTPLTSAADGFSAVFPAEPSELFRTKTDGFETVRFMAISDRGYAAGITVETSGSAIPDEEIPKALADSIDVVLGQFENPEIHSRETSDGGRRVDMEVRANVSSLGNEEIVIFRLRFLMTPRRTYTLAVNTTMSELPSEADAFLDSFRMLQ